MKTVEIQTERASLYYLLSMISSGHYVDFTSQRQPPAAFLLRRIRHVRNKLFGQHVARAARWAESGAISRLPVSAFSE